VLSNRRCEVIVTDPRTKINPDFDGSLSRWIRSDFLEISVVSVNPIFSYHLFNEILFD
jgi:hypothetical protein